MTSTDNPQSYSDADFEAWDQVAAPDVADPAFAALVEADTAAQDDWDHEYHATLGQLRRELGRTQAQVAATMATHQPQVSEIERRDDILVSTARSFVAALGADLKLVAQLPDGRRVVIDLGEIAQAS
jgi:hypothetical protein